MLLLLRGYDDFDISLPLLPVSLRAAYAA